MDPRERFTATVDDYRRHRPDYPEALIDWIVEDGGLSRGDRVVDLGCGTGISSRQLAARGLAVIGVDPNEAMLEAARSQGGGVTYLRGDGETLHLDPPKVQAIVGGQSFHWLDLDRALPRFRELLAPGGRVIPFWNLRDASQPLMAAYEALLLRRCPEYARVGAEPRAEALMAHPRIRDRPEADLRQHVVPHHQRLDREGFFGRVWSSSYVRHDVKDPEAFDAALAALFDEHQEDGMVRFDYRAIALSFRP
ncbi:MAG: class I SAM-dependent methyltransferase [Myxococcales bacterium]|nr:class I SAM-dependent methyltransferase [Myxococcales bacterium]